MKDVHVARPNPLWIPLPDGVADEHILQELRHANRHDGLALAAVTLLERHGFWLGQHAVRAHLHGLATVKLATVDFVAGARNAMRERSIELDWHGIELDRRAKRLEGIGTAQDRVILWWALAMTVGRVRDLMQGTNSYGMGLVASVLLTAPSGGGHSPFGAIPKQLDEVASRWFASQR